jgi:GT2 family glycosyltransferase
MRRALLSALLVTLLLLLGYGRDWLRLVRRPRLDRFAPLLSTHLPLVSILIPARNEERVIGRCVRAALDQHYPHLEVVVVDDGSTDATATILAQLAPHPDLRLLKGRPLPPGWAGKPNVCHQLATVAQGEWLLFLDADTVPQPQLVTTLLAHAQRRSLDMVTIFPFLELGSFWERAILPPFQAMLMDLYPIERMDRPDTPPDQVLANGQCIFVRRTAYEAIGGHAAVAAEILEDVHLAQALRRAGYLVGGGDAMDCLHVRMYTSGREVVEGMAKHAHAGIRASGLRAWLAVTRLVGLAFGPLTLLVAGLFVRVRGMRSLGLSLIALGTLVQAVAWGFWGTLYRRIYGLSPLHAPLWPFGLLAYLCIALRAIWRVTTGRGVTWKGRTYRR